MPSGERSRRRQCADRETECTVSVREKTKEGAVSAQGQNKHIENIQKHFMSQNVDVDTATGLAKVALDMSQF